MFGIAEPQPSLDESNFGGVVINVFVKIFRVRSRRYQENDEGVRLAGFRETLFDPRADCASIRRVAKYPIPPPILRKTVVGNREMSFTFRVDVC